MRRLLQWQNAKIAYEKAIALDPDNALAFQGLSTVYRRLVITSRLWIVRCAPSVCCIACRWRISISASRSLARAITSARAVAFETALRFQPEMINAHRYLATINRSNGGNPEKAEFHRSEVIRLTRSRGRRSTDADSKREKLFDLPEIPKREERLAILLRERPDPKPAARTSGKTFVLVSGLPRSGTSLMMQMLEAGGMPLMTDGERAADVDNPRGYYEWEAIKQIGKKPELLDDEAVKGRAIKCISMLLPRMPLQHDYKVIFMSRPIAEVVASQQEMTTRLGTKGADLDSEQLQRGLRAHREEYAVGGYRTAHELLEIDYPALVRDPRVDCLAPRPVSRRGTTA